MSTFSEDELRRINEYLASKGLPQMETQQKDQMLLANQLRQAAPPSSTRNDWGSNLGRAGYGIAGALQNRAANLTLKDMAAAKAGFYNTILSDYLRKKNQQGMGITAEPSAGNLGYAGPDALPQE